MTVLGRVTAAWMAAVASAAIPAFGQDVVFSDREMISTYVATTEEPAEDIAHDLGRRMPSDTQFLSGGDDVFFLAYTGRDTPRALANFLAETFPELNANALAPGLPVNLNLAMQPENNLTSLRLMVTERRTKGRTDKVRNVFEAIFGAPMPDGSTIMLNEEPGADGMGNMVLSQGREPDDVLETYADLLSDAGYRLFKKTGEQSRLIQADRDGAMALVFVQEDPDAPRRAIIVIRYQEE